MSLTLLPAVDVRDGKAVRLRQGESGSETDYGSPLEAARTWVESGAEWIHLVDLDAAFGTGNNRDQLRAIVKELGDKVNIEMSGGVRDDASLDAALEAGAARVNIGTAALENPDWIYVYNIKKVSPELSEKTSVCPCYHFCSFPARAGKPWEVRVIPLRYNRRACRCLKSMTLSSASRKPSSICSLHIPLSLQDLLSSSMGISL